MHNRRSAPHGAPTNHAFYRDMHFQIDSNRVQKLVAYSGSHNGISYSEVMRRALDALFAQDEALAPSNESMQMPTGDDDPSNPLG